MTNLRDVEAHSLQQSIVLVASTLDNVMMDDMSFTGWHLLRTTFKKSMHEHLLKHRAPLISHSDQQSVSINFLVPELLAKNGTWQFETRRTNYAVS